MAQMKFEINSSCKAPVKTTAYTGLLTQRTPNAVALLLEFQHDTNPQNIMDNPADIVQENEDSIGLNEHKKEYCWWCIKTKSWLGITFKITAPRNHNVFSVILCNKEWSLLLESVGVSMPTSNILLSKPTLLTQWVKFISELSSY